MSARGWLFHPSLMIMGRLSRRAIPIASISLLVLASACGSTGETDNAAPSTTAPGGISVRYPDPAWPLADPSSLGLDPTRLDAVGDYLDEFGSNCMVVIRDGWLVDARSWNGSTPDTDQETFSVSKSVTGTLIGIAQGDGLLDIDDPASKYIEEWRGTASATVTIKNLLSMDSGRAWDAQTDIVQLTFVEPDKTQFAIGLGQQYPPGTKWDYSSSAVQTLQRVLETATGQTVEDFAQARLFRPIGMTATINRDAAGNALMFMGTQASCVDLARFGYLALHDGRWQDDQVVPKGWFPTSTAASQELNAAYGYLWWRNSNGRWPTRSGDVVDDGSYSWPDAPADTFSADGLASQLVIVVPSEDLVIVRLGPAESPNEPEVVGNKILQLLLPD